MFKFDDARHGVRTHHIKNSSITEASITSLKIAITSYFETYKACSLLINLSQLGDPSNRAEDEVAYYSSYHQKYLQTIFHFHHFFELLTKDVLRTIDPLYAVKVDTKDLKVLNAIRNGNIVEDTLHSVEFETAVQRVISLRGEKDAPPLTDVYTKNVKQHTLDILNKLRNRAWHRGLFILRYSELDQFIVQNVLPLVNKVLSNSHYNDTAIWGYRKSTKLDFDPIKRLIDEGQKQNIDYRRIAFYKAVGLASYKYSPYGKRIEFKRKAHSEEEADGLVKSGVEGAEEVRECFVCGKQSLVLFRNDDVDYDEYNNVLSAWWNIFKAECLECNLLLYNDVGNPREFGIEHEDIWYGDTIIEEDRG